MTVQRIWQSWMSLVGAGQPRQPAPQAKAPEAPTARPADETNVQAFQRRLVDTYEPARRPMIAPGHDRLGLAAPLAASDRRLDALVAEAQDPGVSQSHLFELSQAAGREGRARTALVVAARATDMIQDGDVARGCALLACHVHHERLAGAMDGLRETLARTQDPKAIVCLQIALEALAPKLARLEAGLAELLGTPVPAQAPRVTGGDARVAEAELAVVEADVDARRAELLGGVSRRRATELLLEIDGLMRSRDELKQQLGRR